MNTIQLKLGEDTISLLLNNGGGTVESTLKTPEDIPSSTLFLNAYTSEQLKNLDVVQKAVYNAAVDAIESLVLAHACAGVDVQASSYLNGLQTALDSIQNHLA